jgi:hypothetical protein
MMGLIMTFVMILVFIFFIACTVGITLGIKNKNILNIPSWGILISLVFQLLLFTFFHRSISKFSESNRSSFMIWGSFKWFCFWDKGF